MKKSIKVLLSILCLCPMLILSACTSSTYYTINVYTSDSNLGSFVGNYTNPSQLEGTTMTLIANENNSTSSTNPFVCWIKNDNQVVSTNNQLTLTYSSSTAGDYVAVFQETNPSSMIYMALDSITISGLSSFSNVTFTLSYSTIGNSNVYATLESGTFSDIGDYLSSHMSVLCFGGANELSVNQYRFRIEVTTPTEDGSVTSTYTSQEYINNSSFNNQLNKSLTMTSDDDTTIILNFEKLNSEMFSQSSGQ